MSLRSDPVDVTHPFVHVGAVWEGRHRSNAGRVLTVKHLFEQWRIMFVTCSQGDGRRDTTFKINKFLSAFRLRDAAPAPANEVDEMLAKLRKHYGQRVAPVDAYCKALMAWAGVMRTHDAEVYRACQVVIGALSKSNLAARLVYGGEDVRKTPCPMHKGHWSGCVWPKEEKDRCACMAGCNVTGWLPNEPEAKP